MDAPILCGGVWRAPSPGRRGESPTGFRTGAVEPVAIGASARYDRCKRGKERIISIGLTPSPTPDSHRTGALPGAGTYFCLNCGSQLSIRERDRLPRCPRCRSSSFGLDSIFESMQERVTAEFEAPAEAPSPSWLDDFRTGLDRGSRHLAYRSSGGEVVDFALAPGWTRIGRSVSADLRLDDPSVSRRHALVVAEPGAALRVLDDRSLNGIFVNGEPVEWGRLEDGDELAIGSFRLFAIEA